MPNFSRETIAGDYHAEKAVEMCRLAEPYQARYEHVKLVPSYTSVITMILLYSQFGKRGLTLSEIRERYRLKYPLKNVEDWDINVLTVLKFDKRFCVDKLHLKPIYSLTEAYLAEEERDGNIECIKVKQQELVQRLDMCNDLVCGHEMVEESLLKAKARMEEDNQFETLSRINRELYKRREVICELSKLRDRCRVELYLFE